MLMPVFLFGWVAWISLAIEQLFFFAPLHKIIPEAFRQGYILKRCCICEKRCYFGIGEAGDAAADARYKESERGMCGGVLNEIVDIRPDCFHAALHGGYCVALSLNANAFAHDCTEMDKSCPGGATSVHTGKIAAEHKYFVRPEFGDIFGRDAL